MKPENKNKSLLEIAKQHPKRFNSGEYNHDEVDLALAWLAGEVNDSQAGAALGVQAANAVSRLARVVRWCVKTGMVKISRVKRTR